MQRILSKVDIEIKKYPMSVFRKEIKYNKEHLELLLFG